jgi:glycosyltransferase involved in cell wall biosynthesis
MSRGFCFLGGARYSQPLDDTSAKKFQALKSLGQLFVVGFSRNLRPYSFCEHAHFYLLPSLRPSVLRYLEIYTLGLLLALWLIFRHNVRVLIAQSPYEGCAAALAKRIAEQFGAKVVLVVESHGDFEESLFLQRRIWCSRLYRFLMRHAACFALREADLLRAVSGMTRRQLKRWAPEAPVYEFPAWTDIELFLETGLKKEASATEDILYVGVLIPRKGVHHLINAFSGIAEEYPQARLILIGSDANKAYSTHLGGLVSEHGLDGRVQFLEARPQADLAGWMGRARVLVLPSVSEGLGRVVIEAMAASTPVIGSRVGGIPDMVVDGVNGFLVPPGDEVALAERIRYMLAHAPDAVQMGRSAHDFARQFFSTEMFVQGYASLLAEAIEKTCRRQ